MNADTVSSGAMHACVKAAKRDTHVILLLAIGCGRSLTGRFLLAYRQVSVVQAHKFIAKPSSMTPCGSYKKSQARHTIWISNSSNIKTDNSATLV
jgi:hypothetical protein